VDTLGSVTVYTSAETDKTIALAERAHRLCLAILRDEKFMAGVVAGEQAVAEGRTVTLAELDRELRWNK
jgi:hypothetical protein